MRILQLRIAAFGPFADDVDIAFEPLNDAGLFLLTGPNGAGKSSILDAVCFALYGAIPGDRGGAKRFRSDHARPGQAPIVELEAAFASGTYRIVRTPAWERPRKRGSGTTQQPSTVSVSRRLDDGWEPVTTRLDEAGQLITRLVGMNFVQFCQVVILPQGKFQAFLHATADERRALLQQLFHTGRFQRVEAWLRDQRLALGRVSRDHDDAVRGVLDRVSEIAGVALPSESGAEPDPMGWVDGLLADAAAATITDATAVHAAAGVEQAARADVEAARALVVRLARLDAAQAEQAELAAGASDIESLRESVKRARRAAPVMALVSLTAARQAALATAESDHVRAVDSVKTVLGRWPVDVAASFTELTGLSLRLESLQPHAAEAARVADRIDGCVAARDRVDQQAAEVADVDHLTRVTELSETLAEINAAAARLPGVEARLRDGHDRLAAGTEVVRLTERHAEAAAELRAATDAMLEAKDLWLAVREARIDGMAAELAGQLAVGADCPVCGSADHPHPARPGAHAPDASAEQAAHRALDDAKAAEFAHATKTHDLQLLLGQARARAGDIDADGVRATVEALTAQRDVLSETAARRGATEAALDDARMRADQATADAARLRERQISLTEEQRHLEARLAVLDAELAAVLGPTGYATLEEAIEGTRRGLAAAERAHQAALGLDRAHQGLSEASEVLTRAAREAGFASSAEAEAAHLAPPELDRALERLRQREARVAAVRSVLADPELAGLDGVEAPDEVALQAAHAESLAALTSATSRAEHSNRRRARLGDLRGDLSARLESWAPVRERLDTVVHLSSFCEGKAPDNRWQMQLSAYVVAWRLEQVAEAANARLAVMTHGRYALEHTDERGAGDRRGGLGLLIRDDWTGVTRDPVTLSGGESFVVALALALGLADVITAEAGGATLQTLFVDEGFGSLDATSLDEVLDTLDSLRASGRTVGVVSHVAEMRSRIPAQLRVHKPVDGGASTVRVRV